MSNELTIQKQREITPSTWDMIKAMAPAMHASRFFGVASPEQAMAIMIKGHELGLGLASSFEFIKSIQGKPALVPMGALALIQNSPLCDGLKIEDIKDDKGAPQMCRVWMKRTNGFEYTVEFSMDDAKRAGLVKPDSGWANYPANMLRWRAIGFCADVVFPDVLGGLKRADEYGADLTPGGDVIECQWSEVQSVPIQSAPAGPPQATLQYVTLQELLDRYGADVVLAANEGLIPATSEDVTRIADLLDAEDQSNVTNI